MRSRILAVFVAVALTGAVAQTPRYGSNQKTTKKGATESQATKVPGAPTNPKHTPASPHAKGPSSTDQKFMKDAHIGNLAETQLGQMAQGKANNPDVKKFATRMVDDHSRADDQLKQIAQQQHVALPDEVDAAHKNEADRLSKLSGTAFDKAYMLNMVQDHQKTVQKFDHVSKTSGDPEVKNWAQQTLPTLQSHLQDAQKVRQEVAGNPQPQPMKAIGPSSGARQPKKK